MAWSCKRDWMWKILEISCTGNFEKNIEFWVQFASVSERLLLSFFSTIWRKKMVFKGRYCFQTLCTHSNGCIKNLRPPKPFHLGAFFEWKRLPFFSSSLFFIKILLSLYFLALKCPKPHITCHQNLLSEMRQNMQWIGRKDDKQFPYNRKLFRLFWDSRPFFSWFIVMIRSCKRNAIKG